MISQRYNEQMGNYIAKLAKASKPQTNADRIRSMSDEELAHFMTPENYKFPCPPNHINCQYELIPCWMCWAKWLKAPVEVDNG